MTKLREVDALLRTNFFFFTRKVFDTLHQGTDREFVYAAYVEATCRALQDTMEGRDRRLLVTMPPRHLKSICASVALPAFVLGRDPGLKVLVASYGEDLAEELAGSFRRIVESAWYQRLFPGTRIAPRKNRALDIGTTKGGGRRAVSLGGSLTGLGADFIIIDDLLKAEAAHSETQRARSRTFYEETLHSRLNNKETGRIVVVQQRLHEDDFAAYLLGIGTFRNLNLPAKAERRDSFPLYEGREWVREIGDLLCPELMPDEVLEQIRSEIGNYAYSAQYQQDPVPKGSCLFRLDRMHFIGTPPAREECLYVVQSWDLAYTAQPNSNYSVCTTSGFHEDRWVLLDLHRVRLEFPDLMARVKALRQQWMADRVLIEHAGPGIALAHQLRREGARYLETRLPVSSKEDRAIGQMARLESGMLVIPTEPDWYPDLRRELQVFPAGKYDDQVDSLIQFVAWAEPSRLEWLRIRDPETGRARARPRSRRPRRKPTWHQRVGATMSNQHLLSDDRQ